MARPRSRPGTNGEEGGGIMLMCRGQALPPTLTVKRAASLAGCGVSAAYEACRQARWPAIRITERRIVVCTAPFLALIGLPLEEDDPEETLEPEDEDGLEFPIILQPKDNKTGQQPPVMWHPKRRSGIPGKGHRSSNSIKTKTSDANQVNALDPEGSQRG